MTPLFAIVGFIDVFQHIPLAVTLAPPSEVILPPDVAVVCAIFVIAVVVVIIGIVTITNVVNCISEP